ncbi:MAG: proline--tRNA ligase, partial [Candidatus Omnitrophica bacterium CG_4_10_14_0_8_um_filter_43_18]
IPVEAESGIMGGDTSHEFMVLSESGEDEITHKGKKEKAIEIGHVFKLGTKYSKALGANFSDENGKENPIIMGCYGIGINRILAAAIEENHDKEGIIWPKAIAPYQVIVIPTNTADEKINKAANDIYDKLIKEGVEVIIDDRDERAGVKFKDADLIGVPTHVIIGKGLTDGKIEIKDRKTKETQQVLVKDVIKAI